MLKGDGKSLGKKNVCVCFCVSVTLSTVWGMGWLQCDGRIMGKWLRYDVMVWGKVFLRMNSYTDGLKGAIYLI